MKLYTAVALGLVAGLLLGLVASLTGWPWLMAFATGIEPIGQAFVDLLATQSETPSESLEQSEKRQAVRRAIDRLPPALCEVLVLAYFHRFAYKEMAEILGIPLGTIKSRLHSAVGAFGKVFHEEHARPENRPD